MSRVYALFAWGIVTLGTIHMISTFRLHSSPASAVWFFSGGIALFLTGALNLLRRTYGPVAPGLRRLCVANNIAVTLLMAVAGWIGHTRIGLLVIVVGWFAVTTLLSLRSFD